MRKEIQQLARYAEQRGWTVTTTRGGHLKFKHPSGAVVYTGSTPGDHRAVHNAKARLRRVERKH